MLTLDMVPDADPTSYQLETTTMRLIRVSEYSIDCARVNA